MGVDADPRAEPKLDCPENELLKFSGPLGRVIGCCSGWIHWGSYGYVKIGCGFRYSGPEGEWICILQHKSTWRHLNPPIAGFRVIFTFEVHLSTVGDDPPWGNFTSHSWDFLGRRSPSFRWNNARKHAFPMDPIGPWHFVEVSSSVPWATSSATPSAEISPSWRPPTASSSQLDADVGGFWESSWVVCNFKTPSYKLVLQTT